MPARALRAAVGAGAGSGPRHRAAPADLRASQAAQAAAAARAAAAAAAAAASSAAAGHARQRRSPSGGSGGALGPSGGWAIPYAIVLCESGGQNLPPNSAGASGYYQIMPATWKLFGGTGPAAYLAPQGRAGRGGVADLERAVPGHRTGYAPASSASTDRQPGSRRLKSCSPSASCCWRRWVCASATSPREPYHAINDAGTYNRMASMVAQLRRLPHRHARPSPAPAAPGGRRRTSHPPSRTTWRSPTCSTATSAGGKAAVGPERIEMAVTGTISVALLGLVALEAVRRGGGVRRDGAGRLLPGVHRQLSGILAAENLVVAARAGRGVGRAPRPARAPGARGSGSAPRACSPAWRALTHENAAPRM